jgi:outer membrane protein W
MYKALFLLVAQLILSLYATHCQGKNILRNSISSPSVSDTLESKVPLADVVSAHKKSKYQFAQLLLGINLQYTPASGRSVLKNSSGNTNFNIGGFYTPRIIIGGTHFYGHADFSINFPLGIYGKKKDSIDYSLSDFDIITTKYYPWAIQQNKLRPYIGTAFNITSYKQTGTGIYSNYWSGTDFKLNFPINVGLCYKKGNNLLLVDAKFNSVRNRSVYADRNNAVNYTLPNAMASVTFLKMLETTVKQFEKLHDDGSLEKKYQATKKHLNAFSFGLGLSSTFFTNDSKHNINNRPFLNNDVAAVLFPELSVGYYLDKQDVHFNIAYRNISTGKSALGISQNYGRKSVILEGYKFFMDYKGFVPFIGAGVSNEQLSFEEKEFSISKFNKSGSSISPALVFGWDIRYHRNYFFMLRTNMRYYPFLKLNTNDAIFGKINFNQLEVNFIQAVFYPQRIKKSLRYK